MSKPRWIDGGVFRTLRTATRQRRLAVVVGPRHGKAELCSRQQLKEALGDAGRDALAEDARFHGEADAGLAALHALCQPGLITSTVCDTLRLSAPGGGDGLGCYGPTCRGLRGAWDRKGSFVAHLCGRADDPASLVLTGKDRKALLAADSRYRDFLKETFSRTVVFTGFALDDPDLIELLDDVSRVFNGHVPANLALVPAGSTDPSTQLRASVHYAMTIVEFPADRNASDALALVAGELEELEVPKPPTGNPPRGFTELTGEFLGQVPEADAAGVARFDRGDSASWSPVRSGADVPRSASALAVAALAEPPGEQGGVPVVLVLGDAGQGKTTLLRRLAWDLADGSRRVFWRETGVGLPDRYVPAEGADARAVFVADDAQQLTALPALLAQLATDGKGRVSFLLAAEKEAWERSGLDHRVRPSARLTLVELDELDQAEREALAARLAERGRLPEGSDAGQAASAMADAAGCLMDRLAAARGRSSVADAVAARQADLADERLRRAWLAVAVVHRHGMSLGRTHLARLLDLKEGELAKTLAPLADELLEAGASALRTAHPLVADAVCARLFPDEAARWSLVSDLLASLPGGSTDDATVFHAPSELIRALRQDGPMGPLTLEGLFKTGENAADHDLHYWLDRGRHEAGFQRWEEALRCLDRALRRHPGDRAEKEHNAVVQSHRARSLVALGRKKAALNAVDDGLRVSPNNGTLLGLRSKLGGRRPGGARRGGGRDGGGREGRGRGRDGGGGRGSGGPGRGRAPAGPRPPAGAGRQG